MLLQRELDVIKGKMLCGKAGPGEIQEFLTYVTALEELVEDVSNMDFYGTPNKIKKLIWTY